MKIIEKGGVFKLSNLDSINISNISGGKEFLAFCWENIINNPHVSKSTDNQHRIVLKRLEEFHKKINFADLNYSFVKEFDNFLKNKNLHINTIANYHKNFKVFINLAIKKGLFKQENYPYKDFKVKLVATNRVSLTKDEVKQIQSIVFTEKTKSIEFVRDMFLFACYTGLRFSDVQGLKNKQILIEGNEYYIKN